ncbi:hypothetical protein B0A50_01430 [Salinomyces thailandicus]|uniref:RNA helicase n=1 Tax=Salinomyces thailandicus TaxID=706561 RepID=A0A4U0UBS4_9PEZI|nr:hypothetical protein B0A50_01430 [Salinomyces thailandica]
MAVSQQYPNMNHKRKRQPDKPAQNPLQAKRIKLLETRKHLPIWPKQSAIHTALAHHDVLILSGETGSGKSTQIPQFLLDQPYCKPRKGCAGKIAVTQPRRVAAISLARRVAEEMGSPLGSASPGSRVGYSVRFDENTSPGTRIKYLTEGMLLQEILRDGALGEYGCVVVDEVHERSVNVDLLLGFLRGLVRGKRKGGLKVVVMSATAEVEALAKFFDESAGETEAMIGGEGEVPQVTDESGRDDDEVSWNGFEDPDEASQGTGAINGTHNAVASSPTQSARIYVEGRQYPVTTKYLDTPADELEEAALQRIFALHTKEPLPGDILVFLPGQDRIHSLQTLVEEFAQSLPPDIPKLQVLPLFAALPQNQQQRIFQPAPPRTRKVILSTNIAETSVTVPGVRFVVDTGLVKIKQFRTRLGLESLLVKPISRSSADQRQGRAGREAPGQCHRLYTKSAYDALESHSAPEILRCDLASALLTLKARGIADPLNFSFLTPPPLSALQKALLHLLHLSALSTTGSLTPTGRQLSRLPLTPALARVVLEAAKPSLNCLHPIIDIVAALSVENLWLNPDTEEGRERAAEARQALMSREGDHLTLLAAVRGYVAEASDRRRWAEAHMISHRAMQSVMDVRKQLLAQCQRADLFRHQDTVAAETTSSTTMELSQTEPILRSLLAGFAAHTARLCPDGSYKTFVGNQTVGIHPGSVLQGRKVEGIVFSEFVYTTRAWARNVSVVRLGWVGEVLG